LPAALKQQITIQYGVADLWQATDILLKPGEGFHWKGSRKLKKSLIRNLHSLLSN
jgi:hypothetical protein